MSEKLPKYLIQGEQARLFPVLSTTSKEGRTTSIVLACLAKIDEFGATLMQSVGQRVGITTKISTFTEVVLKICPQNSKIRPDGLIVLKTGRREWRALVEAKLGSTKLEPSQIEKYRQLAKDNGIDCVITISNQFATTPNTHPLEAVNKSKSKTPVYHWSWMHILTEAHLLISQENISDIDQCILLNELRRFLSHESAGVRGFDRMPKEWGELNKLVSIGGAIPTISSDASNVLSAWYQKTRDLTLILSRMTETNVSERLSRKHRTDQASRTKAGLAFLRDNKQLSAELVIPDAAGPLEVVADISRRCVDVGMTLRAPEDKVSTKARVNWLLRQIKTEHQPDDLYLRLLWPGKNEPTQYLISELRENPDKAGMDKEHLAPHTFHVFYSKRLGARFTQQANFISDLEEIVPTFYREVGSYLVAWKKMAPRINKDRASAEDVSTGAISDDARGYQP